MSPIRLSLRLSTAVFAALAAALILEFSYPLTHDAAPGVLDACLAPMVLQSEQLVAPDASEA